MEPKNLKPGMLIKFAKHNKNDCFGIISSVVDNYREVGLLTDDEIKLFISYDSIFKVYAPLEYTERIGYGETAEVIWSCIWKRKKVSLDELIECWNGLNDSEIKRSDIDYD